MNTEGNRHNAATQGQVIKSGKLVYTEITINSSPEKVWAVLTDFDRYPEWNPFIRSFKGTPAPGARVEAFLQPAGAKGMTFRPAILQYRQGKELRWIGKLLFGGLFDGEHTFMLNDNGDGTTTLMHFERFRGVLVPFMKQMLDVQTIQGFRQMNDALKARVEQTTR